MTMLDDIVAYKKTEIAAAKVAAPLGALEALVKETKPRGFRAALERRAADDFALIAEIKKASPSRGLIRADFNPAAHAEAYAAGGAACLSVLTDGPRFQGSPDHLRAARAAAPLPVLRKDFMLDPYQVAEARAWGADCILIILACLSDSQARELMAAARALLLDVLVEVHDREEMTRAINLNADLIGVNNRNLGTFAVDLRTTHDLAPMAPAGALVVSESGIARHQDLAALTGAGAKAFLVGESLMRRDDIAAATRALLSPRSLA